MVLTIPPGHHRELQEKNDSTHTAAGSLLHWVPVLDFGTRLSQLMHPSWVFNVENHVT